MPQGVPVTLESQAPILLRETAFGDVTIQLYKDNHGNLFVRMLRGSPMRKTFCPEHFLKFAKAVENIAKQIEGSDYVGRT